MNGIKTRKENYSLSAETIDKLSEVCSNALREAGAGRKDIIRIRLSLEEILAHWMSVQGEGGVCICRTGKRLGRQFITIGVKGASLDLQELDESVSDEFMYGKLMAQAGLSLIYTYKDGMNCLTVNPPRKEHISPAVALAISIVGAIVCGLLFKLLPAGGQSIVMAVVTPAFNTFLGIFRALSSPMIFLAVCCGIISIGDLQTVGKIGKRLIIKMFVATLIVSALTTLSVMWLFPVTSGGAGSGEAGFVTIYQMLLDIIPGDIISPFIDGNALQLICMGSCLGLILLMLGDRVSSVKHGIEQLNEIIRQLMMIISQIIPLFVFLSVFSLIVSGVLDNIGSIVVTLMLVIAGSFLLAALYILAVSLKLHIGYGRLVKKLFPTFLIGLTTASSSAAFATNLEACEKKLGISSKVVNFAVPLEQVLYKPSSTVCFVCISLCMAENNSVAITPVWLLTLVIVSTLISIAAPPIPGGAVTCYTVLFSQLGIPLGAVALALALDTLLDFVVTAASLTCQQSEIALTASGLGMIDREQLEKA